MKILGTGKITKVDGVVTERRLIIDMSEEEADMFTGVAGREHMAGRYKPGIEINITAIYLKVKSINERYAEIIAGAKEIQSDAAEIENTLPLT